MKTFVQIQILFFLTIHFVSAQSKFGIEFKLSRVKTENSGKLIGGGSCCSFYTITREGDAMTSGFSIGGVYKLNERNLLKLHFGRHQNGRVIDLTDYDDTGSSNSYTGVNVLYRYFQIAPSYTYRIINKKFVIPVEIGVNINRSANNIDVFYVAVNGYNFDYKIGTGLQYRFIPHFLIGLNGIYTGNINEYQDKYFEWGTFKPKQFGMEVSVLYEWSAVNGQTNSTSRLSTSTEHDTARSLK
ncbi:MAG: hypothetical protein WBP41_04250 [Saprospiraceae bacterium]